MYLGPTQRAIIIRHDRHSTCIVYMNNGIINNIFSSATLLLYI